MTTSCCMAWSLPSAVAPSLMRVDGGGTLADGTEHLLAVEDEFNGFAGDPGRHAARGMWDQEEPLEPKPPPV